jgi:transcription initiation factor IIE alpha subunit
VGLFTRTEDKHLEEARKHVAPGDTVCPNCKEALSLSGATLTSFNAAIGLEGHTCPKCGQVISRSKPGFGRL